MYFFITYLRTVFGYLFQRRRLFFYQSVILFFKRRHSFGAVQSQIQVGINLNIKVLLRNHDKSINRTVANQTVSAVKADVLRRFNHTHDSEGIGFQAVTDVGGFQIKRNLAADRKIHARKRTLFHHTLARIFRQSAFLEHRAVQIVFVLLCRAGRYRKRFYNDTGVVGCLNKAVHRICRHHPADSVGVFYGVDILIGKTQSGFQVKIHQTGVGKIMGCRQFHVGTANLYTCKKSGSYRYNCKDRQKTVFCFPYFPKQFLSQDFFHWYPLSFPAGDNPLHPISRTKLV